MTSIADIWTAELDLAVKSLGSMQMDMLRFTVVAAICSPPSPYVDEVLPYLLEDTCTSLTVVRLFNAVRDGLTEDIVPKESTPLYDRARHRIRYFQGAYDSMQLKVFALENAELERQRQLELKTARSFAHARTAALAACSEARRSTLEQRDKEILAALEGTWHNFKGVDPVTDTACYVKYTDKKQLFVEPGAANYIEIPEAWNGQFYTGRVPFLTQCPVCRLQNRLYTGPDSEREVFEARCPQGHYAWNPATNEHRKCGHDPLTDPVLEQKRGFSGYRPVWNPKDPFGKYPLRS
jgi:hypothetical protein